MKVDIFTHYSIQIYRKTYKDEVLLKEEHFWGCAAISLESALVKVREFSQKVQKMNIEKKERRKVITEKMADALIGFLECSNPDELETRAILREWKELNEELME